MKSQDYDIAIIGGGASGFFAALRAAELGPKKRIVIFESSPKLLSKVRISGGGRCNVTHNEFDVQRFCQNYPRGHKELRSPFHLFHVQDTIDWFSRRGVKLISETDGRMFPSTHSSETIVKCFIEEAQKQGVEIITKTPVRKLVYDEPLGEFELELPEDEKARAKKILIATGSAKKGHELAAELGHTITQLAPSLFSFKIKDPLLKGLSGTSFSNASLKLCFSSPKKIFHQSGPLLITHHGLSGPAALKLSAWAAREMKKCQYKTSLIVNWTGAKNLERTREKVKAIKENSLKSQMKNAGPRELTHRFWLNFLSYLSIDPARTWGELSKKDFNRLCDHLFSCPLQIIGQNRFKEEFVECGGVKLKEIDLKTMQSKLVPGLHFSGEILDVDGVTGGFNFQNAWTTGHLAGSSMAMGERVT